MTTQRARQAGAALATTSLIAFVVALVLVAAGVSGGYAAHHSMIWDNLTNVVGTYRFLNYDGARNTSRHQRDFPITIVFYRNASMYKARAAVAYPGHGSIKWEPYKPSRNAGRRIQRDAGRKSSCRGGRDTHFRVYG